MFLLFILQNANTVINSSNLERRPAFVSVIYIIGMITLVTFLLISTFGFRKTESALVEALPDELKKRLSTTATNRGLKIWRWGFVFLAFFVFGFHVYWAKYAEESNPNFQELNYKDLRNRRLTEANLRGWILDRTGKYENALARYKVDSNKDIVREYPLDSATVHLLGTERGAPGLERALFSFEIGAIPDAVQIVLGNTLKQKGAQDVRLTIDVNLQRAIVEQLKGRHGAVVVMNPQTGGILGLYSNPSYSVRDVQDIINYTKLEANKRDEPLVNRALSTYYVPGSTYKTLMMIGAQNGGFESAQYLCSHTGFSPQPGSKVIWDDGREREVHGMIDMGLAYEVSCNQYFAQSALALGQDRVKQAAESVGIGVYDPMNLLRGKRRPDIWNASTDLVKNALAPKESTMAIAPYSDKFSRFDFAIEGYGQGMASQMTPLQMAMMASAIANTEGKLMKPKIEYDRKPEVFKQVLTPQGAFDLRQIMGRVVSGSSGTARNRFNTAIAKGIKSIGGKTGTAQKEVYVYDEKTGEIKTRIVTEKDPKGNIIRQYEQPIKADKPRVDSWFLCIAPLERPDVAIAVIVEGGGYGSSVAAPIAANLLVKAKELGLIK